MLACRPMLSFAAAVMLGVLAARFYPDGSAFIPLGWAAFFCLALWFALTPRNLPDPPEIPDDYARHILPRPKWAARRGVNRFILIAAFGLFLLGMARQRAWERSLDSSLLPGKRWFDAVMLAAEPAGFVEGARGRWRAPVWLLACDGAALPNPVRMRLSAARGPAVRRGDLVEARIRMRDIDPPTYPGAFDLRFFLERDGLAASADAVTSRYSKGKELVRCIPVEAASWYAAARRSIDAVRFAAIEATLRHGGDQGGMLATMLFGYRGELSEELRDAFRRVGIGHVLAISGLHVGLVVWLLWWGCGWLGWSRRWRAPACLLLAVLYLGLAGGQVAATRATIMAVIYLGGIAGGRRSDMLNSLGAAAFLIVLINPSAPLDVSFQLSFTAVVFIYLAIGGRPDSDRPRPFADASSRLGRFRRQVISLVRLSIATWIGLYPIVAIVFNQVNLVGLPINVVVIPLMGAVLAGGLLLPLLGWIPGAAWLLTLPARALTAIASFADALPGASFAVHAPGPAWVAVFFLFVLLYMLRGMAPAGRRRAVLTGVGLAGAAIGLAGVTASMAARPPPAGGRLTHLPGSGMGVVVAESPGGGMALVGNIRRGGLSEAGWLHHLKRSGDVAVVALGRATAAGMLSFAYHYRLAAFENIQLTRKAEAGAATPWRRVPGAEDVEYSIRRDEQGRISVLGVRIGTSSLCVVPHADGAAAIVAGLFAPGEEPELILPTFSEGDVERWRGAFRSRVAARGRLGGDMPEGWHSRHAFGAMTVEAGAVRGYDGSVWLDLPPAGEE